MKRFSLLLILGLIYQVSRAQLSAGEKRLINAITANLSADEKLLAEVVNINSGSLNIKGVRKTGEVIRRELETLGFSVEWIVLPDSLGRAGHLVASKKGKNGRKRILLIGHLDTVFEQDMAFSPYTRLCDSIATGQGVNDMKGGDVIMISALRALRSEGLLDDANITVYFTGDEEKPGQPYSVARADFIDRAKSHDIALGFEGAQGLNTIATARRGSSSWTLSVEARTGHSSGVFGRGLGYGAIYEAARVLDRFRQELDHERYLTLNPGLISGGSEIKADPEQGRGEAVGKTNIVAPATVITGDLRFISEQQKDAAREKMRAIVSQPLNGAKSTISFSDGYPAMEPTPGNNRLVSVLNRVSTDLRMGATLAGDPGSRGAGDVSFIARYVDCIDGLGASGGGSHKPGETINLKELPLLIQRAAILISRLAAETRP